MRDQVLPRTIVAGRGLIEAADSADRRGDNRHALAHSFNYHERHGLCRAREAEHVRPGHQLPRLGHVSAENDVRIERQTPGLRLNKPVIGWVARRANVY